jgi:hypothetical protein
MELGRGTLVALILFACARPVGASGSSEVHADSQHFRVELESVRKIFSRGQGEREWHESWKAEARPRAHRIAKKLEAVLPELVTRLGEGATLVAWDKTLPEVTAAIDEPDSDEARRAPKGKPVRYVFRLGDYETVRVSVAFAALPSRKARKALEKALGKTVEKME